MTFRKFYAASVSLDTAEYFSFREFSVGLCKLRFSVIYKT